MKRFTFNKQFMVLMFLLLNCFASYATGEDLITKQITIKLTEAGTLPNKIASNKKNLVTNLKIIGEINGTDLRFIREMAGCYRYSTSSSNLSVLDLSEARIVKGGSSYDYEKHYTSNDIIGGNTFYNCTSLTSIKLPSSVIWIEDSVFVSCTSLTSVNIPSSITKIGNGAFSGCTSLTSVDIPSSMIKIGSGAFSGCTSLTSIDIPSSVIRIENESFQNCTSLTSVNIPSGVSWIGNEVFQNCTSLTSVNIPSSVTYIGWRAFSGCTSLTSVNIPSSVTLIPYETFSDCCSLTSIKIPSSVTMIGGSAFYNCTSLTSVKIPSSVTEIGEAVFYECNNLKSIYVFAEDVPSINTDAFKGCDSKNCIVYVPKGTYDAYWLSEFGYFENIIEFDATSIHNTIATPKAQETARYAVNGQRLTAPINGINLVKYSDGTVKKEFVK